MSSQRQSQPSQQNVKPTGIHAHPDDFYDPAKSTTSTEALQVWLQSPLSDDLGQVPGIGNQYKLHLREIPEGFDKSEEAITTPFQLVGKYLMFKQEGLGCVDVTNRFFLWLKARGIKSGRNSVTEAIAEKCNVMLPGLYNRELFVKPV